MDEFLDSFESKGYHVFDSFVDKQNVFFVLEELSVLRNAEQFKKAGIGKQDNFQIDKNERGDFISWINKHDTQPATKHFLTQLEEIISQLNRNFYLGIRNYECHYTQYPVGTFYKKHVDRHKAGSARIVSFVFYLNENWQDSDGGQLRIFDGDNFVDILPSSGRLAIFLSEKEHEVLPTNRVRNSITGWMLNEERL